MAALCLGYLRYFSIQRCSCERHEHCKSKKAKAIQGRMAAIGKHKLAAKAVLAPMAGVTDLPFRQLCLKHGAAATTAEMLISNAELWHTRKSQLRLATHIDHQTDDAPSEQASALRIVQIAGSEPAMLADAARRNEALGADIVDINMGCPAKKVCKKAAGSSLLREPELVEDILRAVVAAVDIPVTLKIRTGWCPDSRNGVAIAQLAQDCGIQSLAVHGRTRACRFKGAVEYDTIAAIKQAIDIPVWANGDICSPEQALNVLAHTGADGVMIGRAAQGQPWLFEAINAAIAGEHYHGISQTEWQQGVLEHLQLLHRFYGELQGMRIARKHIGWYFEAQPQLPEGEDFRRSFNRIDEASAQRDALQQYFAQLADAERLGNISTQDISINNWNSAIELTSTKERAA